MEKGLNRRLEKGSTGYMRINTHNCEACWKCIDVCPKQVIGKIVVLWHKHIKIINAENCINCKKCIQTCPHGVFNETNK